jgi:hypothetical protein
MHSPRAKARTFVALSVVVALFAWCAMMALYFKAYDLIEQSAVPVSLQSKEFTTRSWSDGYFHASGSLENQSAIDPGAELPPQGNAVTCVKETKTCTIATGTVFSRYLDVDLSQFDISSWTDQQITFSDDSPICVTNSYVIDRAAQTMTLLARKKAIIPDYAAKSELHPCDNIKDANIDLADGFKVYWRAKTAFEAKNGFYFHAALVAMNLSFFGVIAWLWRRRKQVLELQSPESSATAT